MNSLEKHKSLYKGNSPHWKDTYRKRCQDRLKKNRGRFLDKFRQAGCSSNNEIVDQVMAEEWQALSSDLSSNPQASAIESDLRLFEEIRAELIREEQQILAEYESSLQLEEAISKSSMEEQLVCPVCQKNPLMKNKQVIFCYCGVRIDTETDCTTLGMVKNSIDSLLSEHSAKCSGQPRFSYNDFSGIGMYNILMTCEQCNEMFIVV